MEIELKYLCIYDVSQPHQLTEFFIILLLTKNYIEYI